MNPIAMKRIMVDIDRWLWFTGNKTLPLGEVATDTEILGLEFVDEAEPKKPRKPEGKFGPSAFSSFPLPHQKRPTDKVKENIEAREGVRASALDAPVERTAVNPDTGERLVLERWEMAENNSIIEPPSGFFFEEETLTPPPPEGFELEGTDVEIVPETPTGPSDEILTAQDRIRQEARISARDLAFSGQGVNDQRHRTSLASRDAGVRQAGAELHGDLRSQRHSAFPGIRDARPFHRGLRRAEPLGCRSGILQGRDRRCVRHRWQRHEVGRRGR